MTARYATPADFGRSLVQAWSLDSSSSWTAENPAKGQCSVTSLVAQDVFGGDILTTRTPGGTHFYNCIDGERFDFTISQFSAPISFDDIVSSREEAFRDTSPLQYSALRRQLGLTD
ncbi:hypothetical protein HFC70_10945 [Agrobacterium sp. a22-2]|uniref:YunG family protein n=1 Tax=Agrobacterium sp. a22-2 TaxID=2283840 RepID=UPI0014478FBB|nr:hypothetical protein [Agrobacterium sp. a22-2]NKN36870.1 hypothetical protein [Agrobacterium sp. a22-2]